MTAIRSIAGRRRRPTPLNLLTEARAAEANCEPCRARRPRGSRRRLPPPRATMRCVPAYRAEFLKLPSESDIARELAREVDTDAVHAARETLARHDRQRDPGRPWPSSTSSAAPHRPLLARPRERGLASACATPRSIFWWRPARPAEIARAERHYREAANMTDAIAALSILSHLDAPARDAGARRFLCALAGRASRARQMVRGAGPRRAARLRSRPCGRLLSHPKFSLKNPNRIRALLGSFVHANPTGFNRADGAGYRLLADQALEIDRFNPHVAARLLGAFESWRILEPRAPGPGQGRAWRISRPKALSTDSYEIVTKTLGRGLKSVLCQRVINRISTAFLWTDDALIDSNDDAGNSEMRQLLRLEAGERLRGTEWRGRVLRVRDSLSRGRTGRISARLSAATFPMPSCLRRLVPILLAGFACVAVVGFTLQLIHGKQRRPRCGEPAARADRRYRRAQSEGQDPRARAPIGRARWPRACPRARPPTAGSPCSPMPRARSKPARRSTARARAIFSPFWDRSSR